MLTAAVHGHLIYEPYNWNLNPEGSVYRLRYVPDQPSDWRFDEVLRERFRSLPADGRTVVIKEVMTALATPYLHRRFGGAVVMLIRHPCAVARSWHELGWHASERIPLLLAQPALVHDHLAPYVDHLIRASDPWTQLGALWGALHLVMRRQFRADLNWQWITYEWLCEQPAQHAAQVATLAGCPVSEQGREALMRFVQQHDRRASQGETPFETYRETALQADRWRSVLTSMQQSAVLAGVEPFGLVDCWNMPPENVRSLVE
jgi:hypothetical protein